MRIVKEWERVVEDKDIDAVVIAVPDFWHAPITVAAAQNKKDVYVEKGWCVKLDEAKAMRAAVKDNKVVMQLGHHMNSIPTMHKAREIFRSGALGKIPLVRSYIDRTNAFPEWQFYTDYAIQQRPADATEENIDWKRFVANSPHPERPFDPERFFTWRRYWDYGTGHRRRPAQPHLGRGQHGRGDGHTGDGRHPGREVLLEGGPRGARHVARPLRLPEEGDWPSPSPAASTTSTSAS